MADFRFYWDYLVMPLMMFALLGWFFWTVRCFGHQLSQQKQIVFDMPEPPVLWTGWLLSTPPGSTPVQTETYGKALRHETKIMALKSSLAWCGIIALQIP